MSLEPIKKQNEVSKSNQSDFLVFRDSDLIFSQELKFQKTAGRLEESKKLGFELSQISSEELNKALEAPKVSEIPTISDEQLETWLADMIRTPWIIDESGIPREVIWNKELREEIINCYLSNVRDIAHQFPKIVNAMMKKNAIKCFILLPEEKTLNFFKKLGVELPLKKHSAETHLLYTKGPNDSIQVQPTIFLSSEEIFEMKEKFKIGEDGGLYLNLVFPHEFLHIFDLYAANLDGLPEKGENPLDYSGILNRRLKGRLETIGRRQSQSAAKAKEELKSEANLSFEKVLHIFVKNKSLMGFAHVGDLVYLQILSPSSLFNVNEIFVHSLDLYFKDKQLLKEIEPEMYDIIEHYVLPDLSK